MGLPGFFGVLGFDECFEIGEVHLPEAAVLVEPCVHGAERFGVELVNAVAAFRRRCLEMAGRETGKAPAISPAGWLPRRNKSRTARRVGSASAWKVASGEYVTERFRIMRNRTVTGWRCQEVFSGVPGFAAGPL